MGERTRMGRCILVSGLLVACAGGPTPGPGTPRPSQPAARLVVVGDLDGTLEPCGCTSRPRGGIGRIATRILELGAEGIPTLVLAVGDTFFGEEDGSEENLPQKRIEASALARSLDAVRIEAVTPGPADFVDGLDGLREAASGTSVTFLASNLSPGSAFEDARLVRVGRLRVGLFGIVQATDGAGPEAATGIVVGEPLAPARRALRRLRGDGADVVVALASVGRRAARGLPRRVPGIDLVFVGGADTFPAPEPEVRDGAILVAGGHRAQSITVVDLYPHDSDRTWEDGSRGPSRLQRLARVDRRIRDLEARIGRASAAEDRRRLESEIQRLQRERRVTAAGGPPTDRSYVTIAAVEIGPELAEDPPVRALVDEAVARVGEANALAFAEEEPPPVPEGSAGYVGSERCGRCHEDAERQWRGTAHANAWATLEERHKHRHLDCVGCHLTGYRKPGGATLVHNELLQGVQCEACHGPASLHVASRGREEAPTLTSDVPATVCTTCHTPEHSDLFDYRSFRARIVGPGHGLPLEASEN